GDKPERDRHQSKSGATEIALRLFCPCLPIALIPAIAFARMTANKINFRCPSCGTNESEPRHAYAEFAYEGYDEVVSWSDFTSEEELPPVSEDLWPRAEIPPVVNEERIVRVTYPFEELVGQSFFTFYQPALAAVNGYREHPEELA